MLNYVAKVLTAAGILAKDLQDLEQWTHSDWQNDANEYVNTRYFSLYTPRLQEKSRADQIPHRRKPTDTHHGTVHVFARHATEEGKDVSNPVHSTLPMHKERNLDQKKS